jgi:hypothetical protein
LGGATTTVDAAAVAGGWDATLAFDSQDDTNTEVAATAAEDLNNSLRVNSADMLFSFYGP